MLAQMINSLDFQGQALTLRSQRQQVLASNIANADTPGYVAREFNFTQKLLEATNQDTAPGSEVQSTQAAHMPMRLQGLSTQELYAMPSQGDAMCKGCGRTFDEVQHWPSMSPAEKRSTWRRITMIGTSWRFNKYAERALAE